jgi:hypothetical protein
VVTCSWFRSGLQLANECIKLVSTSEGTQTPASANGPVLDCMLDCLLEVGVDLGFHTTFPKPCPDWWADGKRHGYRYDQISVAYNPFLDGLAETRAVRRVSFSSPHPVTDFSLPAEVLRTGRHPFGTSVAGLERALVASSGFTSLWARYSTKGTSTSRTPPKRYLSWQGRCRQIWAPSRSHESFGPLSLRLHKFSTSHIWHLASRRCT